MEHVYIVENVSQWGHFKNVHNFSPANLSSINTAGRWLGPKSSIRLSDSWAFFTELIVIIIKLYLASIEILTKCMLDVSGILK